MQTKRLAADEEGASSSTQKLVGSYYRTSPQGPIFVFAHAI
jgi:hypothetical protein